MQTVIYAKFNFKNPKETRPLQNLVLRGDNNKIYPQEMGFKVVNWILLPEGKDQQRFDALQSSIAGNKFLNQLSDY
jgi:hypothetical protein